MNPSEVRTQLSILYSKTDFSAFCALIGEPTKHDSHDNFYALEKWEAFQNMCTSMNKLGTFFDRLFKEVEVG